MGVFFTADELIRIALDIEDAGYGFYKRAGAGTESPSLRGLFEHLAEQEKKHKETFLALRDRVSDSATREEPAERSEVDPFIRALIENRLFAGADQNIARAAGAAGGREAADYALEFEKDTLLFFYQLLDQVRSTEKTLVQAIIQEEKDHVRRLAEIRKTLA